MPTESMAAATAVETPAKALASVTRSPGEQPIVLTLVARDAQEGAKIGAALEAYSATNRKSDANYAGQFGGAAGNGGNFANGFGIGNWNADNRARGNDAIPQPQVVGGQVPYVQNGIAGNAQVATLAGAAGPYRVGLRAEQLAELAEQYRVAVVARGSETYVFGQSGERPPATAERAGREDVLRRVGLADGNNFRPNGDAPARQQVAAAPGGPGAAAPAGGGPAARGGAMAGGGALAATRDLATAPAVAWFDCVITVEGGAAAQDPPATGPAGK
jgi:hypothetical protein